MATSTSSSNISFMYKKLRSQLLAFTFCFASTLAFSQQVLFVVGDDNPGVDGDGSPELYIQSGQDAFIYIQGGMTVITPGGDQFPAEIVNNGAIFIKDDGTGGNFVHQNGSANDLVIDRTAAGAMTYTLGNAPGTAYDTEGGAVHLMSDLAAPQVITRTPAGSSTSIHFHTLSIDGPAGSQSRSLQNVDVVVGRNAAGTNTGRLLLNDDYIDVNSRLLTVTNSNTDAVERNAAGSDAFVVPGMHPDYQFADPTKGMVVTSSTGGLGRAVANTQTGYLFPVGNSQGNYRPVLVKFGGSTPTQMFIARNNGVNPFTATSNFSTVAGEIPVAVDPDNYWDVGSANVLGASDQALNVRLYETLTPMGTITGTCTVTDLLNELGVAQKRDATAGIAPNRWADENAPFVVGQTGGGGPFASYLYWSETTNLIQRGANQMVQWNSGTGTQFTLDQTPLGVDGTSTGCTPFPVEMVALKATAVGNSYIKLDWTTLSEVNNAYFHIERSLDGQSFYNTNMLVNTQAAGGNSSSPLSYTQNDFNVQPNTMYYYRLRIVDLNGSITYSNIVNAILFNDEINIGAVYPNPTNGEVNIQINTTAEAHVKFMLYNPLGQQIFDKDIEAQAGENIVKLDLSSLAIGTYQLVVRGDGKNLGTVKLIRM